MKRKGKQKVHQRLHQVSLGQPQKVFAFILVNVNEHQITFRLCFVSAARRMKPRTEEECSLYDEDRK